LLDDWLRVRNINRHIDCDEPLDEPTDTRRQHRLYTEPFMCVIYALRGKIIVMREISNKYYLCQVMLRISYDNRLSRTQSHSFLPIVSDNYQQRCCPLPNTYRCILGYRDRCRHYSNPFGPEIETTFIGAITVGTGGDWSLNFYVWGPTMYWSPTSWP